MLTTFFVAAALAAPAPVDSAGVYAAVLSEVRRAYPGIPVVLSEARAAVRCMPLCGAALRDPDSPPVDAPPIPVGDHSPELLRALSDMRLIEATCPFDGIFGCAAPGHLFVALGEIQEAPPRGPRPEPGGVWVQTAFMIPCQGNCPEVRPDQPFFPDAFGLWFLLRPDEDGEWKIVRNQPSFAI